MATGLAALPFRVQRSADESLLEATLRVAGQEYNLHYRVRGAEVGQDSNALLALALLPAMQLGSRVCVAGPVSPLLRSSTGRIQEIFTGWRVAELSRVELDVAEVAARPKDPQGQVGTFFSGGIDSFYTLLKHREEITAIIHIQGFDYSPDNHSLRERTLTAIRSVAEELGKTLVEVETNLKDVLVSFVPWNFSHGAALASVAHVLSPCFKKIYVPASYVQGRIPPWGSHPMLDSLWSTESTELEHDGCEASRVQKAAAVAECDIALKTLRVCWENPGNDYNCGRCEKCLRTMINLHVVGALEHCATFTRPLDLRRVACMPCGDVGARTLAEENLEVIEESGTDSQLADALRAALQRPEWVKKLLRPELLKRIVTLELLREIAMEKVGTDALLVSALRGAYRDPRRLLSREFVRQLVHRLRVMASR